MTKTDSKQTGKVALVTGAARGIGLAVAKRFLGEGYRVALLDIEAELLAASVKALNDPDNTLALPADVSDEAAVARAFAELQARFGRLDALVNNASSFQPTRIGSTTPAQWDALFASNARAPFFLAQAAAPHLKASRGAIVNLADIYAERPLAGHTVYCMAKAALVMATRSLALELAPEVRVNAVAPGAILWPEHDHADAAKEALLGRTPLARIGTVEEIATAVSWLLRDATYSTGQVIHIDGGRLLAG